MKRNDFGWREFPALVVSREMPGWIGTTICIVMLMIAYRLSHTDSQQPQQHLAIGPNVILDPKLAKAVARKKSGWQDPPQFERVMVIGDLHGDLSQAEAALRLVGATDVVS